jgi:carboxyl-terminal processing protease
MNRRNVVLFGVVGLASFVSGGWLLQRGGERAANVYQKARIFESVVAYLAEYYVDSLDESKIYDLAIDGLLKELKDPYTAFLRPDDVEALSVTTTGNYGGLGIRIEATDGWIQVVAPLPETPAERAGVLAGDRIIEVEGESTHDWPQDKAVGRLRGAPGAPARITIARPGIPEPIKFTIVRERIHVRSVEGPQVLPGGIGYLRLVQVSESSAQELGEEVERLRSQGARSLVLDLRNNPGGLLNEGVAVSDLFLDRGEVVVETRGRAPGASGVFRASRAQRWPDMPLVVLVNGNSASAAEIIAGALQDHDRALIVGTTTFGKGLVQSVFELGPGPQALKLTTGRWYTPSGRVLERPSARRDEILLAAEAEGDSTAIVAQRATGDTTGADSAAAADSARPRFRTDGGRVVLGGGGITPDRLVRADTLTTGEQAFAAALGRRLPEYRAALTAFALDVKGRNGVSDTAFTVTPAMRAQLIREFRKRGIDLPDSVYGGAAQLLDEQLGDEIARYVFSRQVEIRRQLARDPQVREAIGLLRQARSPAELFTLAAQAERRAGH